MVGIHYNSEEDEHDELTGFYSRKQIEEILEQTMVVSKRRHKKIGILLLDLDHFKTICEPLTIHQMKEVIKTISDKIKKVLRPEDKVGRLGTDEFLILLDGVNTPEDVAKTTNRIRKLISEPIPINGSTATVTGSFGIAIFPDNGLNLHTLLRNAATALCQAKKRRNTYQFSTLEMTKKTKKMVKIEKALDKALLNEEFVLYYQPIINIQTNKISSMEALLRWKHRKSFLLPDEFIFIMESKELIIPLAEWILKKACLQNKVWNLINPGMTISANLSKKNFNNQLPQIVDKALKESNLAPNLLQLELTESLLMEDIESNIKLLHTLKEMGLTLLIDDFGTGYSSLKYLKNFPVDFIKIDKSFIQGITKDPSDAAIVDAILKLAEGLKIGVIAEGVENEEELKYLKKRNCYRIQGYYFSPPLPSLDATQLLMRGLPKPQTKFPLFKRSP